MDILLVILIVLILTGGTGVFYTSRPAYTGPPVSGVLGILVLIVVVILVVRLLGAI
jgi:hypothetical protein